MQDAEILAMIPVTPGPKHHNASSYSFEKPIIDGSQFLFIHLLLFVSSRLQVPSLSRYLLVISSDIVLWNRVAGFMFDHVREAQSGPDSVVAHVISSTVFENLWSGASASWCRQASGTRRDCKYDTSPPVRNCRIPISLAELAPGRSGLTLGTK